MPAVRSASPRAQTASGTRKTSESIRELVELAAQLRAAVSDFRLPETQIESPSNTERPGEMSADYNNEIGGAMTDTDEDEQFVDQKTA